jgi:hypothetical protein
MGLAAVQQRLVGTLQPLMVRHTKRDLQLPPPIILAPFDGMLAKSEREYCGGLRSSCAPFFPPFKAKGEPHYQRCLCWEQFGETEFVERTCLKAARHVLATLQPQRVAFQRDSGLRQVRKTPCRPRSGASFSLFLAVFPQECMGQLASFEPT